MQKNRNMKKIKTLIVLSMTTALTFMAQAGKTSGGTTSTGAFTFGYNVGTVVANYHVYGLVCQVGAVSPRPAGTVVLGNWWVRDLGHVTGTGQVSCPAPIVPKGQTSSILGALFFADAGDVGGQAFAKPVVEVEIFTPKWYSGYASIQVITPIDGDADDNGIQLYWGPRFSPFACDFSDYVWDTEPATW
jgi:hypothetical protein